jgi:hypothetical protein
MRILPAAFLVASFYSSQAQKTTVDVGKESVNVTTNLYYVVGGEPFVNAKFVRLVEGTPYFKDDWMKGTLVTKDGKSIHNVILKLDMVDNEVHYLDQKQNELIATLPVKEVMLIDTTSGIRFHFIRADFLPVRAKDGWYQDLYIDEPASLYKLYDKIVSDTKPYGSATAEQRIRTADQYFVVANGTIKSIKKIKDLPSVLPDKKAELDAYLASKDNKALSMDERMKAVIQYYNSLQKKS